MHTLSIGKHKFPIPGNWNELTDFQLLTLAALVHDNMDLEELKIRLLFSFTGIKAIRQKSETSSGTEYFWIRCGKKKHLITAGQLAFVTDPFMKFFRKEENGWIVFPLLTRQLLPHFTIHNKKFFGPADGLSNITLREFIFCESVYRDFIDQNSHSSLDKLVSILYRPAGKIKPGHVDFNGDIRGRFNDFNIDAKAVVSLNEAWKKAILWYYEGSKRHIATLFPAVFSEGSGEPAESVFNSFMTIVDELANNQPAEHERIMDVFLYSALQSLNKRIEKAEAINKQLKENGKV